MTVDGILNMHKPAGMTSFDVVRWVRRLTRERRVGHGGTLDPAASGVLPLFLGQATRVVEFFSEARKTYRAQAVLGVATDTYDAEGKVTETRAVSAFSRSELQQAVEQFTGVIEQVPPPFSAVKYQGKRSYELARAGQAPPAKVRTAMIYAIKVLSWGSPVLEVEIQCGKGTYVRSLVHDLGMRLGCLAHVKSLVRMKNGLFAVDDAVTLEQFRQTVEQSDWRHLVYPVDHILTHMAAAIVDEAQEHVLRHGQPISVALVPSGLSSLVRGLSPCRAYSVDGRFVGVLRLNAAQQKLLVHKVLSLGYDE